MTLKKVKNNLTINGVEYDVWYNPDDGTTQVRTDVGTFNKQGDLVWDSVTGPTNPNDLNSSFINAIKGDDKTVKNISNVKKSEEFGVLPGFLSNRDVDLSGVDGVLSQNVAEMYETTNSIYGKDEYFDGKKSAQYPLDALYKRENGSNDTQDHLVISQYRYKPPRADDIWGKGNIATIITQGIARTSPLDEFLGLVKMPMPNAIQDSNNVAWGEDTVNALEAAALNAVQPNFTTLAGYATVGGIAGIAELALGGSGEAGSQAIAGTLGTRLAGAALSRAGGGLGGTILGPEAVARILGTAGIETSAEAILARKEGVVPNSNLELLFSGPTLRQFAFVYKMSPRSREEARTVNQILRFFKQGMAAKKLLSTAGDTDGRSYFLGTPNVFRLQYRTTEEEAVKGLNRIKTCALTGTSVNYTPEGAFASYDRGQPVSVLLSLNFQELEPIYDTDYKYKGGKDERQGDEGEGYRWRLDPEEVGY